MIDRVNAIRLHLHRPPVGPRNEGQDVQAVQRLRDGRQHGSHERIADVGTPCIGGVLRIGQVIHRRPIKDHVIRRRGITMDAADS
jgi:hypothetical protein